MICTEDLSDILPLHICGKIVGVASYRGDYIIVACERGLYKLWDDGIQKRAYRVSDSAPNAELKHET